MQEQGVDFYKGNKVKLLMSGYEKFDHMFEDIRQARSSVHLEYFNFRNDSIASLLFDILKEKRKEGVEVRALFDGFGNDSNNKPLRKRHLEELHANGIDIHEFDPIRFPWINHIWPRDHRKIVVIDGRIAYTGGMNVADYYLVGTEQVGEWHDMHCRIEGPAVNELQRIFARMWKKVTKEDIGDSKYYQAIPNGNKTIGIVNREPDEFCEIMRRFYLAAIDYAQDSVKIINPYFAAPNKVMRALKRCAKRGVKMDIIISAKYDEPLMPDIVMYNMRKLIKRGVRVWRYRPGFHHSKIMMVDGRLCTVGSANLDSRGLYYDYEVNAVIPDTMTTRELEQKFLEDTRECDFVDMEEWNRSRTTWQRIRGWLGHLLTFLI